MIHLDEFPYILLNSYMLNVSLRPITQQQSQDIQYLIVFFGQSIHINEQIIKYHLLFLFGYDIRKENVRWNKFRIIIFKKRIKEKNKKLLELVFKYRTVCVFDLNDTFQKRPKSNCIR